MQDVLDFSPTTDHRSISSFRRESSFWQEWALLDLDTARSVVTARFYGSGPTVYCVTWFHDLHRYGYADLAWSVRGYGKAGGYGYHKQSAAFAEALQRAGVSLAENVAGVGETAMQDAMEALAKHLGIARHMVHKAHA